jgi:multidrug efflux pump subunit AcrA (membrane-fusion protein)
MTEVTESPLVEKQKPPVALMAALGVALVLVLVALYLIVDLRGRVTSLEGANEKQIAVNKVLEDKLHLTNKNMEASMEALGSKVGMTQEELARRTGELRAQQERAAARLAAEQQATNREVASVSSTVSGVKTELGGAQTDIAATKSDLAATKAKLETAIGDLNVHSGLIAKSHEELEFLKHKGDRNYFEFTLKKKERKPLSTVSLELKKSTAKKSRFTLNVYADDHTIEKKDRTLGEPLQFYTGRDKQLYEVVIFNVTDKEITGYLATPKQ